MNLKYLYLQKLSESLVTKQIYLIASAKAQ